MLPVYGCVSSKPLTDVAPTDSAAHIEAKGVTSTEKNIVARFSKFGIFAECLLTHERVYLSIPLNKDFESITQIFFNFFNSNKELLQTKETGVVYIENSDGILDKKNVNSQVLFENTLPAQLKEWIDANC